MLILYAALILGAMYLLVIRPSRQQRAQRAAISSQLKPGARVMLTSGLLAHVLEIDGDEIVLDVGDGVHLRYVARAVATVFPEPTPEADVETSAEPDSDADEDAEGNSPPTPNVSD